VLFRPTVNLLGRTVFRGNHDAKSKLATIERPQSQHTATFQHLTLRSLFEGLYKMNMLITSGGTKVPIDSVRHIGNMSSGTFGAKIGLEALKAGHRVTFLMAAGSKSPLGLRLDEDDGIWGSVIKMAKNLWQRLLYSRRIHIVPYSSFESYEQNLARLSPCKDAIVLAAAVSDYDVANKVDGKMRTRGDMRIELKPLPKLISNFKAGCYSMPQVLVGFKLLVGSTDNELLEEARRSAVDNRCTFVVANDLRDIKASAHRLLLVDRQGGVETKHEGQSKDPNYLAREVVKKIASAMELGHG
jgi:phosphopantothenoylcysteine synthetase/decarboxylase